MVLLCLLCFFLTAAYGAEPALQPVRACDVLSNPAQYEGKVLAIVGRFSFRSTGRSLGEEACEGAPRASMRVGFDKASAPKTPEHLEIDSALVTKLVKTIQQRTALAKFKFGTPDFDRWAVVYGRMERGKRPEDPPQLLCAGDSVVMFLVDRY